MKILKLIFKNSGRHLLRTSLTILGIAIAVMAFAVIRSSVDAWYSQAEAASPNRLVVRNKVSIGFSLPLAYRERIQQVEGVKEVAHGLWFAGIYIDPSNFFAQFAIERGTYLNLYPEFIVPPDQLEAFNSERNAAIVGLKLADRFGWQIGDVIRLSGTIYPGDWDLTIRGIYTGAKEGTDETVLFLRWDYLDERMREDSPSRAGQTGWFVVHIEDPDRTAAISNSVDSMFANSWAETRTETEEAFQLSFVAMASQVILGLRVISYLVIGVILLVLGNTMAMTARERVSEYALMKTLGFGSFHIGGLILGESLFKAVLGGALGIGITFPIVHLMQRGLSAYFPVLPLTAETLILAGLNAVIVGFAAAIFPTVKALRTSIVDGLRIID